MRRQVYLVGAAISVVALAAAAAAVGAGGVSIVSHAHPISSSGAISTQAKCAAKDHVLGGGFSSSSASGGNIAQVSKPGDGGDSWTLEMLASAPMANPGKAFAYALCERASQRELKTVKNSKLVPSPPAPTEPVEQTVKAKCPKGWQVVSGGYEVRPPFDPGGTATTGEIAVDTSMRKSSRVWKVHGGNDGDPTKLIAYALCEQKGESEIDQVSKTDSTGTVLTAAAKCPKSSHLVGGGFRSVPDESSGNFPEVNSSYPASGRKWKAQSTPTTVGASLTSYGECEKG